MIMKISSYKKGTTFECLCAHKGVVKDGRPFLDSFGIIPKFASMYGRKPEDIVTVRGTIIEEDIIVKELMKHDSPYDSNAHDYFGWIDFEDDGSYNLRMIYGNIKLYYMCFPNGPDIGRFYCNDVEDIKTWKIIHKAGDRRGMTVRLEFEIIKKS